MHSLHFSAIEFPNRSSKLLSSVDETDEDSMLPLVSLTLVVLLLLELIFEELLTTVPEAELDGGVEAVWVGVRVAFVLDDELAGEAGSSLLVEFFFDFKFPSEFLRLDELSENVKHSEHMRCVLHSSVVKLASDGRRQYEQKLTDE